MTAELEALVKKAAAAMISAGAREVYLFGSSSRGIDDAESDIDLAIAGLPPALFFRTIGLARRILKKPVDLIDLDEPNPFTDYLKTSGGLIRVA
ncbi:MAG: nucleotidyltransferase domain-containing protein [bacterium]|nr:nucleotidyltransferase domain-containing protein [bacterium]